jgi:hypothetical protein
MTSFKQFLLEDFDEFPPTVLKLLKTKCSQFLSKTTTPMVRGITGGNKITNANKFFMVSDIRTDRAPRDSAGDHTFNFYYNLGIESAFGEANIRRKSLFCSGDISVSEFYGSSFFVFPVNGFKYISSTAVKDSFKDLQELSTDVLIELRKHKSDAVVDIYNFFNGPKAAEVFRHRGQITLKEFEALTSKDARKVLSDSLESIFTKKYKYQDSKNLDACLKHGSEILIYDTRHVFMVNITKLREALIANPSLVPEKYKEKFERGSPMMNNVYAAFLAMIEESK